jgi:hypothetical protein
MIGSFTAGSGGRFGGIALFVGRLLRHDMLLVWLINRCIKSIDCIN